MAFISFALSLHSLTGNAGTDAGFAAILGLAILALLYFAQARETSTLRDSLKRADDELGALHERLNTVIAAQAAAAQRAAPAPVPPPVVRPMEAQSPRCAWAPVPQRLRRPWRAARRRSRSQRSSCRRPLPWASVRPR